MRERPSILGAEGASFDRNSQAKGPYLDETLERPFDTAPKR